MRENAEAENDVADEFAVQAVESVTGRSETHETSKNADQLSCGSCVVRVPSPMSSLFLVSFLKIPANRAERVCLA